jgi:hypothetical protein
MGFNFSGLKGTYEHCAFTSSPKEVDGGWWYGSVVSGRYVIFIIGGRRAGTKGWIADERE